jgi:hypothetical protein
MAVNHDGDSDSTGSVTGNLLRTMCGVEGIPAEWLTPFELRSVICEITDDLYSFPDWHISDSSSTPLLNDYIWKKYPGF